MAVLSDNSSSGIIANAPILYQLMTNAHDNTTSLVGFNIEPHVEYLQGDKGVFNYQKLYANYPANAAVTNYPYAAVGIIYLTNPTNADVIDEVQFKGSADSSSYGAAVLTALTSGNPLVWTPVYQILQSVVDFNMSIPLTIPANETLILLMITTANPLATSPLTTQFISFNIVGIRKLLKQGIKINTRLTTQNSQ
jgi:hypothetical protein